MLRQSFLMFVALLAASAPASAADRAKAAPASAKAAPARAKAAPASAPERPLRGPKETLACRLGTEDRHARIAVVLIGGKTSEFAYYSKWKPRTCSIYVQRSRDAYSKWKDAGNITTVNLERGVFLIEHSKGEYRFEFRDIDRERYCGMDGKINGSLVIRKGSDECVLSGDIMVEGTPLGEAHAAKPPEEGAPAGATIPVAADRPVSAPAAGAAPTAAAAADAVGTNPAAAPNQ